MKRWIIFSLMLVLIFSFGCVRVQAAQTDTFDDEIRQIEDSIDDQTARGLDEIGAGDVESVLNGGVDTAALWNYLLELFSSYSAGPLSALTLLTAVMLLAGVAESYTTSLRYTDTKDIMSVVMALFVTSVVVEPVAALSSQSVTVIQGASAVMAVYLPVMAGILVFSGHAVASGGYYAAVTGVSQLLSRIAASALSPLLNCFLSLSVSAGICSRVRLEGLVAAVAKGFKYLLTFSMSIFIAVIGLNSALASAADGIADKAAKFSLSSFIPLIGSSISEAYGALQSSVNILRSGVGVFVILAVFVAFAPVLVKTLLWSAAIGAAKLVGEALSVSSAAGVLNALSQYLAALRAMVIAVMTAFIISSSIMISVGGHS